MSSLQKITISSVKWTTVQTVIVGIIGPISLVIKSRFLSPEEFAYVAIISIIISLFHLLESFGISQAIIQRDNITQQESSSLFFFNIFYCAILAGALFLLSPIIAELFSLPKLTSYLPVVSVIVFLTGPSLLFRAFLEKNMGFKNLSLIAITRNILTLTTLTILLVLGFGVMGFVIGQIVGSLFATLSIIYVAILSKSVRLSIYFKPKEILPFLRFGVYVSLKQLLTFIAHRADELLIGYLLSPDILGIYHFGKSMLEKLRSLITNSFGKVLFPVLSKLKHNDKKLSEAYQRISRYIAFGAFPVFAGISVTAHLFVPLIFGEQWLDSVLVFQVFSIAMIFIVMTANVSTALLFAVNKPKEVFYIDVVTIIVYFISLSLFASLGIKAILVTYTGYIIFKTIILQYFTNKQLLQSFHSYVKGLSVPVFSTLFMVSVVLMVQFFTSSLMGPLMLMTISMLIGGLSFLIITKYLDPQVINEFRGHILKS